MNWKQVGAIGQVLGSLAVFITLVYLAIQTRHARSESQRALGQGRAEATRDINALFADERIVRIMTKAETALDAPVPPAAEALMERAKLTRDEAGLFVVVSRTVWNHVLQMMPNIHELSAMERHHFEDMIRFHYKTNSPSRIFYEPYVKARAHPDAVRYVESVLAQPG